jgi:sugar-phosphatase
VKVILFDVDGVLLDSAPAHRRIWSEWADEVGLDFELVWAASHGRRISETLADVAPHLEPLREESRIRQIMLAQGDAFPAQPGARTLLTGLPVGRWAVVTSAKAESVRRRFAVAGLPVPKVLIDNEAVSEGKPHPEGYLSGAASLGCSPDDCLVVEDAPAGVAAGKAAGMSVLALGTTHEAGDLRAADWFEPTLSAAAPFIQRWLDRE